MKILSLIVVTGLILYIKNIYFLAVILVIFISGLLFFKKRRELFSRLRAFFSIGLLIFISQLIFFPSHSLQAKMIFSAIIFLKLLDVSIAVLFFVATTSAYEIADSLWFLPKFYKMAVMMTFYLIPVIFKEAHEITEIQASKGFKKNGFNFFPVVIPLLHRVFLRTRALSETLVSRGFIA